MLLVCISIYLKVLRYKYLIVGTYRPDTLREQGREDPWLFFEAKRGPRTKKFGKRYSKPVSIVRRNNKLNNAVSILINKC
jgi:hypothetical protein